MFFACGVEGEIGILNRYLIILKRQKEDIDISQLYDEFESLLNEFSFFSLDLQHTDSATYGKMSDQEKANVDYLEDDINEETGRKMSTRNMHTIPGKNVDIKKISQISGSPIELVKKIFDKYKSLKQTNGFDIDYLDSEEDLISGFIDYIKEKELNNIFSENEIGKATIENPISEKDKAKSRYLRDEMNLEQIQLHNTEESK